MRVLLVEDDASFGLVLQSAFAGATFVTEWVANGVVALAGRGRSRTT